MLDRMIESKNDARTENSRRNNFLLTTLFFVAMLFGGAMLYSLYAKPLGMTNENLEFSMLVAPVAETEPSPAELPKKESDVSPNPKIPVEAVRQVIQKTIDESPDILKGISTVKNQYASRPPGAVQLGAIDSEIASSNSGNSREGGENNAGIAAAPKRILDEDADAKEPPKMPKSVSPQPKKPVSLGVANGFAKNLPVPIYPAAAKAVHATGAVNVQITIDEQGRVISAKAVTGHPLLRQAAEQAAQRATFSPTLLSKIPVKATGVIVYNFVAQ
ncbi:MAG: TonB family protein [Pyrinomonadaceae bacterium]